MVKTQSPCNFQVLYQDFNLSKSFMWSRKLEIPVLIVLKKRHIGPDSKGSETDEVRIDFSQNSGRAFRVLSGSIPSTQIDYYILREFKSCFFNNFKNRWKAFFVCFRSPGAESS